MQYLTKLSFIKNRLFSLLSILLSVISLIAVIKINRDISARYLALDGKTQLLLGLTEFVGFYFIHQSYCNSRQFDCYRIVYYCIKEGRGEKISFNCFSSGDTFGYCCNSEYR